MENEQAQEQTFNLNEKELKLLKMQVVDESIPLNNMVDSLVAKYGRDLERSIEKVRDALKDNEKIDNNEIERFIIDVPVHMYFALEGLEKLGIEGDNAKMNLKSKYNMTYNMTPGTIEDKKKTAELATMTEEYLKISYERAYRKLKERIVKAEHVFTACKKVLDKRTQELFMNKGERHY